MMPKKLTDTKISEKLSKIYSQVLNKEINSDDLISDVSLIEKYHIDSFIALQIIVKVEQEFGVIIEDDEMAIRMLDSLENFLEFFNVEN